MKYSFTAAALAAVSLLATQVAAELSPIVIKGSKFFTEKGDQFYIKGVAYQQEVASGGQSTNDKKYKDPLADAKACRRDVPALKELSTNTIRVYAIDPTANHDECMKLLDDAGIYVILDLSQPGESVIRDDPTWDDTLFNRYKAVIDRMSGYSNLLGYFAGNEVSNQKNNTAASAFVKAAVRDSKAYIRQKNYRSVGVGYATNDDADIRANLADYFNCNNQAESIDFWGYNIYSWCGDSSFQDSGFDIRTREFQDYSVPVFFAEYGCNEVQPREFTEVGTLYGDEMSGVWSGGIVYMYFQEANDYGLVTVDGDEVTKLPDFDNLASQVEKVRPSSVKLNDYNPTNTALSECPRVGADWGALASPLPPTPNSQLCTCMKDSLSCNVQSTVDEDDYGDLFGTVCGLNEENCKGIVANGTTGEYGAYSMCSNEQKLSFVLNRYYISQGSKKDACDFNGAAGTRSASKPEGECKDLLAQAGTDGSGVVPGATQSGSATSKAAAGAVTVPNFDMGMLKLGAYVICAGLSGMALILL